MEEISILEVENPDLIELSAVKKRWTHVSKDPSKVSKDTVSNSYWGSLNHMPLENVGSLVTDKILKFD